MEGVFAHLRHWPKSSAEVAGHLVRLSYFLRRAFFPIPPLAPAPARDWNGTRPTSPKTRFGRLKGSWSTYRGSMDVEGCSPRAV